MDDALRTLVHLQQIDSKIDSLNGRMNAYPEKIRCLEHELAQSEQDLTNERNRRQELEKEQRHFERELQNVNHEMDKHNKRLFEIKTNEEYQALLKEIESLKLYIEEFEGKILERMTALDDLSASIRSQEEKFSGKKVDTASNVKVMEAELADLQKELDLRQQERDALVVDIHDKTMRIYERVRSKNKVAVVAVHKGACGGCFERLPPQRINEIRRNEGFIFCENCGSILVWDEEGLLNNQHDGKKRKERPE